MNGQTDSSSGLLFGNVGMDSASPQENRPSILRYLLAFCLIATFVSGAVVGMSIFKDSGSLQLLNKDRQEKTANSAIRWEWEPYALEYALYLDRGYDLSWLEGETVQKVRSVFGKLSAGIELVAIRIYGLMSNVRMFVVITLFVFCAGRVSFHRKVARFENISSTVAFRALKFLFLGLLIALTWAAFPFGVQFPFVGGVPIVADLWLGATWVSSPLVGFWIVGAACWFAAYLAAANFRLP